MFFGYLVLILPCAALLSLFCYLPAFLYQKRHGVELSVIRHLAILALIGTVISILYITVFIFGVPKIAEPEYRFYNFIPFVWVHETYEMGFAKMVKQLCMNIVMLIPMGIFLPAVFRNMRKWWKTAAVIFLLMLCIETVQYFIGRSADVDDLIMNTFGGMIGYGIYLLLNRFLCKKNWWKSAVGLNGGRICL